MAVLDTLQNLMVMHVPPLELHQVCSGGLEKGLQVVLGLTTVFPQCLQMVPYDCDLVTTPLNIHNPERHYQHDT